VVELKEKLEELWLQLLRRRGRWLQRRRMCCPRW